MKMIRYLLLMQGSYYLINALWALIDLENFMHVTGSATDVWFVRTVSVLLIPISLTLFTYLFIDTDRRPAIALGSSCAIALAIIDVFTASHAIAPAYAFDGGVQIIFFIAWIAVAFAPLKHRTVLPLPFD